MGSLNLSLKLLVIFGYILIFYDMNVSKCVCCLFWDVYPDRICKVWLFFQINVCNGSDSENLFIYCFCVLDPFVYFAGFVTDTCVCENNPTEMLVIDLSVAPLSVHRAAGNSQVSLLTSYRKWTDGHWVSASVVVEQLLGNYRHCLFKGESDPAERCALLVSDSPMLYYYDYFLQKDASHALSHVQVLLVPQVWVTAGLQEGTDPVLTLCIGYVTCISVCVLH